MTVRGLTPEQRFWSYVWGADHPDRCWIWLGAVSGRYGKFFLRRERGATKVAYAHRFSDELVNGPIPSGLEIDHLCSNTLCVNPAHFERVTGTENKRRQGARRARTTEGRIAA